MVVILCLRAVALGAEIVTPELKFNAALPVVIEAAKKAGITTEGITAVETGSEMRPGDRVTTLVSLTEKGALSQWLVELTCVELEAAEKQQPIRKLNTFYANTGTKIDLGGSRAALAVRVLGPYVGGVSDKEAGRAATDEKRRVLVNADYLALGLDLACESVVCVNAAKAKDPSLVGLAWKVRGEPFPEDETKAARVLADRLGLTPERERACVGINFSLLEFFKITSRTPGVREILSRVIDVPWWAIIKNGGKLHARVVPALRQSEEIVGGAFGDVAMKAYALPFVLELAGKPALSGKLAVTQARPPLLPCAGIFGIAAQSPDGKGPHFMLQLIAARRGEMASSSTQH